MSTPSSDLKRQAIDNGKFFAKQCLPSLMETNRGQWALLRNCELIEVFATSPRCLFTQAQERFPDGMFSFEQVYEPVPISIGIHALADV